MITPPEGLRFPEWKKSDGPAAYVWKKMPAGNKCAWSCSWVAAYHAGEGAKVYTPSDWRGFELENLTEAQIVAELNDIAALGIAFHLKPNASGLVQDRDRLDPDRWMHLAREIITIARPAYPVYLAEWSAPPKKALHMPPQHRPGWNIFPPVEPIAITDDRVHREPKADFQDINLH